MRVANHELDASQSAPHERAQEIRPKRLSFTRSDGDAEDPQTPSVVTPTAIITATETMRPACRTFTYVASIHTYGKSPPSGRLRKASTRSSISLHRRDTWLFDMPAMPVARTNPSTDRDALDVRFLHDGDECLSAVRRGSKKPGEIPSFPELRNANVDRFGARLPQAIAIAIATVATVDATLTIFSAATLLNPKLHEPLDDVPEEISDDIILRPLLDELGKCDTGLGHRGWYLVRKLLCKTTFAKGDDGRPLRYEGDPVIHHARDTITTASI